MKKLERICLVQFFLYDAQTFEVGGHCAFLGPNGTGKTVLLDALQIAMVGAHGNYLKLNAQKEGGGRDRTIREYCLGALDGSFKRSTAQSYITLVFKDGDSGEETSIGVAISASQGAPKHEVAGMYIARGIGLQLADHMETLGGGEAPLRYGDFRHALKVRGDKEQKTVLFENHAEKYIANMLLALGDRRRVDQRAFLSAFHKSVLLRNIESVDKFVRDFLIDPRAINKQAAAAQIERFKHLAGLVKETQQQIARLAGLEGDFERLRADAERAAGYEVLAATLARDAELAKYEDLQEAVEKLDRECAEGNVRSGELASRVAALEAEQGRASAAVQSSEPLRAKAQAEEVLKALQAQAAAARNPAERIAHSLERALYAVAAEPELAASRAAGAICAHGTQRWCTGLISASSMKALVGGGTQRNSSTGSTLHNSSSPTRANGVTSSQRSIRTGRIIAAARPLPVAAGTPAGSGSRPGRRSAARRSAPCPAARPLRARRRGCAPARRG